MYLCVTVSVEYVFLNIENAMAMKVNMELARRMLSLVTCAVIGVFVYANGDPVAAFSSVNRVANPEPLSISEVVIEREDIDISHVDGYNCFDVTYRLKNLSDKDFPEIHYGFPIDYLVADERDVYQFNSDYYTESIHETGWNENLIRDVAFVFNSETLPFHSSKESVMEAGYEVDTYENVTDSIPYDGVNRRWFYTSFSMKPHSEATLNVRYKVYAHSRSSLYSGIYDFCYFVRKFDDGSNDFGSVPFAYRHFVNCFEILYDFSPAKHFGDGTPYPVKVNINLSNLENPCFWQDDCYFFNADSVMRYTYAPAGDIKPIKLTVSYGREWSEAGIRKVLERFSIPASEFDISEAANTVTISFHKPTFVSELVCDIDTASIKEINASVRYADGRQQHWTYEANDRPGSDDHRIKSPVLLTITDLYHDELMPRVSQNMSETDDKYAIDRIELEFDTPSLPTSLLKNIKVLDSRFK